MVATSVLAYGCITSGLAFSLFDSTPDRAGIQVGLTGTLQQVNEKELNDHMLSAGFHLWNTEHDGERWVYVDSGKSLLTIETKEPDQSEPITETYSIGLEVAFVVGGWNDFLVGGYRKVGSSDEMVIQRWRLPQVDGAYEGDVMSSPPIGQATPITWPSGEFIGTYVDPLDREKRAPIEIEEILEGGIGTVESALVDGCLRFVLLTSREDGCVYRISLYGQHQLEILVSSADIPWLADPTNSVRLYEFYPSGSGAVVYGVWGVSAAGVYLDAYSVVDSDNDGVLNQINLHAGGFLNLLAAYPMAGNESPVSSWR